MEKKPDRSEIITMTLLFALTLVLTVLSQFSKIVPLNTAYLRYAVCGCCLCIKNANCYKSDESAFIALVVGAGSALDWHTSVPRLGLLALGNLSQRFLLLGDAEMPG